MPHVLGVEARVCPRPQHDVVRDPDTLLEEVVPRYGVTDDQALVSPLSKPSPNSSAMLSATWTAS